MTEEEIEFKLVSQKSEELYQIWIDAMVDFCSKRRKHSNLICLGALTAIAQRIALSSSSEKRNQDKIIEIICSNIKSTWQESRDIVNDAND